ncbi:MAG TPA: hypothetical protein VI937_00380 [Negativicutes bacterium]|nr:hypothetical protein [Negativicutes bacterium]
MTPEELIKNTDLAKVASQGALIYQEVKKKYEENSIGKFLAIDIDSKEQFLASTSAEAVVAARAKYPGKVFYVVKIGFDAAETMAHLIYKK